VSRIQRTRFCPEASKAQSPARKQFNGDRVGVRPNLFVSSPQTAPFVCNASAFVERVPATPLLRLYAIFFRCTQCRNRLSRRGNSCDQDKHPDWSVSVKCHSHHNLNPSSSRFLTCAAASKKSAWRRTLMKTGPVKKKESTWTRLPTWPNGPALPNHRIRHKLTAVQMRATIGKTYVGESL